MPGIPGNIIKQIKAEQKKACLILGLGSSLKHVWKSKDLFYIGVNDICRMFKPDITYIPDYLAKDADYTKWFPEQGTQINIRYHAMLNSNSRWVFTENGYLDFPYSTKVKVRHLFVVNQDEMNQALKAKFLWGNSTSIVGAISLAILLGFKTIGLLGFDLYGGHAFNEDSRHPLSKQEFVDNINAFMWNVFLFCCKHGVSLENLSATSRIYTIPKRSPEQFITDHL